MTSDPDRLYELVPAVYRMRDADQGYALRALLRVVAEQVDVVEHDIANLYENWFIETCEDWVVPYLGALIGYAPLSTGSTPLTTPRGQARERITVPRREVANTIRFRRRKGTLSLLEQLAESVAGWPVRAVEFYRLLAVTQNVNYLRMDRGRSAELRDGDALDALGTAFDETARNADVRRATSGRARGTANIADVGLFVWRMRAYTVTNSPAFNLDEDCYVFSPLGNDTQLYVNPRAAGADPALPLPITRRAFERRETSERSETPPSGVPFFYGPGNSLMISTGTPPVPVPPERIVPADLSDWSYRALGDKIAVDPVLGRLVVSQGQSRKLAVWVWYTYGFSADIGGGEYDRPLSAPPGATVYRVGAAEKLTRIGPALTQWIAEAPADAVIELTDSAVYAEPLVIDLKAGQTLQLRAANGTRPVIRLVDLQTGGPDALSVSGEEQSWFVLDGVVVTGGEVEALGNLSGMTIRHCTLVPGLGIARDGEPAHPGDPSLEVRGAPKCITIEHSILGAIEVERDETKQNPLRLDVSDSIVDATRSDRVALGAEGKRCADAVLNLRRSTVIGQVQTRAIELAENSILLGTVHACRRQWGCVRFCYVGPGSQTPRRYECQPDLVEAAVRAAYAKDGFDPEDRDALLTAERLRVEPEFDSTRYGTPAYCGLAAACAPEITTGADDDSELGVFHDLYAPQRAANLRRRLDEYTPAGTNAGIIYAS